MFDRTKILGGVIDFKIRLVIFTIKGRKVPIVFNMAPIYESQLVIGGPTALLFPKYGSYMCL